MLDTDGNPSSYAPLNTGVPQGSVLGPLLFCLYMNNISDIFHDSVSYLVHTNNLQMYIQFPLAELDHYVGILSRHARLVARLAEDNHLRLNVSKTKAIVFGFNFYINKLTEMPLKGINLDHTTIKFETSDLTQD